MSTPNITRKFVSFFAPTENRFCTAEQGTGIVTCNRTWVQQWELFSLIEDKTSGDKLIQANEGRKFLSVQPDGSLKANQTSAVREARFEIDEDRRSIRSVFNKKYLGIRNGKVCADYDNKYFFETFNVEIIAISDRENVSYARRGQVTDQKVKNAILMDSTDAKDFYMLTDSDNNIYLETSDFEFLLPHNTTEPVGYSQTAIDTQNFKVVLEPVSGEVDLFKIKSIKTGYYFKMDTRTFGGKEAKVIYCDSESGKGEACQFKIRSNR